MATLEIGVNYHTYFGNRSQLPYLLWKYELTTICSLEIGVKYYSYFGNRSELP